MSNGEQLPHLIVTGRTRSESYVRPPSGGGEFKLPSRDRATHGSALLHDLNQARQENEQFRGITTSPDAPARIILEIESLAGLDLALTSLEPRSQGVEVACTSEVDGVRTAVIHVPEDKLNYFVKLVEQYLSEVPEGVKPRNQNLIDRIARIRLATLRSFWTDEPGDFPPDDQAIWWETWLRAESDQDPFVTFQMLAEAAGLRVAKETIRFPDRLVALCFGTAIHLSSSAALLDFFGEIRLARENPAAFVEMGLRDQGEFVDRLRERLVAPPIDAPAVCILDSGVKLHPLIRPALAATDLLKYDPAWPLTDEESHGTEMAGMALFGDQLPVLLQDVAQVYLRHWLESVKILPPPPLSNEPRLYGAITAQSAYRIEIQAPTRTRSFCMAVTTRGGKDQGRPSSWSGEVDQLCAGVQDGHQRLFFVSAGNVERDDMSRYPDSNDTDPVQDPGQAWNAVTVGAYTDLVQFSQETFPGQLSQETFPGQRPIAQAGDLAPSSTTSLMYLDDWPYKPDLVLEGGNAIVDPRTNLVDLPEQMSLLTTAHATGGRLLVGFGDTSAATGLAAWMGAQIQADYPDYWPETVRALLIHSAEWTPAMQRAFTDPALELPEKKQCSQRLRRYGYGVPNLGRALRSARNALTLIVQDTIQPFHLVGNEVRAKDMRVHDLPWPIEVLQSLGEQPVTMRVTLSYFIEPKPGRRGFPRSRHWYASHELRFDVKRPLDTPESFLGRISVAARDAEYRGSVGNADGWTLGPKNRTRGSIHSDWWRGTASDLAACGQIIVYPVSGWWRDRRDQRHWGNQARYALAVSILAPEVAVDIYTPVETQIATEIET